MSNGETHEINLTKYINFYNELLEMMRKWPRQLRIEVENHDNDDEPYVAYIFKFDFNVHKYESFVLIRYDDSRNDIEDLIKQLEDIDDKASTFKE